MTCYPPLSDTLIKTALDLGATDAVPFRLSDICFDSRTLLKCAFGCKDFGKAHTCPSRPGAPTLAEYRDMLLRYAWGVIVHTHDKPLSQKISLRLESDAFAQGKYFAFSLSDCGLCKTCAGFDDLPCRFPDKARPAFHSVGIDVFKTVHALGLPLETLAAPGQEQNWYSAVFVE